MTGGRVRVLCLWYRREPQRMEAQGQGLRAQLSAPARTVPNRELRRDSCARSAAPSTTATRHPTGRRPCTGHCSGGGVPMSTRAARPLLGTTGDSRLGARLPSAHSRPVRPVRRTPSAPATRRLPGWMKRIGTTHRPTCTEPAINACPARRSSGTSSRFGADMGVRQRAGE